MSEFIQGTSQFWVEYFGLIVIQNSLFIILILLLLMYFRNISAKTKYLVCIVGVVKLLIPPFIPFKMSSGLLENYFTTGFLDQKISAGVETTLTYSVQNTVTQANNIGWIELLFLLWIAGIIISLGISIIRVLRYAFNLRGALKLDRRKY